MTMTYLTTAYTALSLGLACRERREIVMQQETHIALVQHIVHHLLVQLGTQCCSRQGLSLTTGKDSTSMRHWQRTYLAPDRTYLVRLTTIKASTLVQDTTAHSILLHIMIVTVYQSILLCQLVITQLAVSLGILQLEILAYSLESLETRMLLQSLLRNVVSLLVASSLYSLAQLLVINLMTVFALYISTQLPGQLLLQLTHRLDGSMSTLQSLQQITLLNLLHLTLYHHDILLGSTDHQVHIRLLQLSIGRIDYELAVYTSDTNLTDRTLEWNIATAQRSTCSKTGKSIRHVNAIGTEQNNIHINLGMIVAWEQWTQCTVHQTACKDFLVICLTLTLCETARETSGSTVLFTVFNLQRHKICARNSILGSTNSGQEHSVVHTQHNGTIGLFGQLSGLYANGTSIR